MPFDPNKTSVESGITYGRKPYITGDDGERDYLDQMRRVPRRAIEVQREKPRSNFDKPYITEDYSEMEQFQPPPLIRPQDPNAWNPDHGIKDVPVPEPDPGNVCALTIIDPFKCCCESTVSESRLQFCRARINAIIVPAQYTSSWVDYITVLHNGVTCTLYKVGGPFPIEVESADEDGRWYDGDIILATLKLPGSDGYITCSEKLTIRCFEGAECCDCDPFQFDDDNTSDTIDPGGSIEIYVTGGCPGYDHGYTFEITNGDGYTIGGESEYFTENRYATLSCAEGDLPEDFSASCNIKITDGCGSEVTAQIFNTDVNCTNLADYIYLTTTFWYESNVEQEEIPVYSYIINCYANNAAALAAATAQCTAWGGCDSPTPECNGSAGIKSMFDDGVVGYCRAKTHTGEYPNQVRYNYVYVYPL